MKQARKEYVLDKLAMEMKKSYKYCREGQNMHLKKFNVLKNWDYHDSSAPLNLRLSNIFFLGMV